MLSGVKIKKIYKCRLVFNLELPWCLSYKCCKPLFQIFGIIVRNQWCCSSTEAPTWRAQGTCLTEVSSLPMEMWLLSPWTIGLACWVSSTSHTLAMTSDQDAGFVKVLSLFQHHILMLWVSLDTLLSKQPFWRTLSFVLSYIKSLCSCCLWTNVIVLNGPLMANCMWEC